MSSGRIATGRLLVCQEKLSPSSSVDPTKYDFVLGIVSWESRCTFALRQIGASVPKLFVLRFEASDREVTSRKESFVQELKATCDEMEVIQLKRSVAYAENMDRLDQFLSEAAAQKRRPLRVLCDITCLPKSYILLLLGMGFSKGYFARLDCLYSEGDYEAINTPSTEKKIISTEAGPISEGKWDSLPVPFFEGGQAIPGSRDVLVTLGGEVGLAIPFIEKYEPERLSLVVLKDGTLSSRDALAEMLAEPNVTESACGVSDVVGIARHAMSFCDASKAEVVSALAVGSKPHALGLGVAALDRSKIELICRIPKRYTMLDVPAAGVVRLYKIEDRFEPHAYF